MVKIHKYFNFQLMKWVDGYKIFGIYFLTLSLYKEKVKYIITLKLP